MTYQIMISLLNFLSIDSVFFIYRFGILGVIVLIWSITSSILMMYVFMLKFQQFKQKLLEYKYGYTIVKFILIFCGIVCLIAIMLYAYVIYTQIQIYFMLYAYVIYTQIQIYLSKENTIDLYQYVILLMLMILISVASIKLSFPQLVKLNILHLLINIGFLVLIFIKLLYSGIEIINIFNIFTIHPIDYKAIKLTGLLVILCWTLLLSIPSPAALHRVSLVNKSIHKIPIIILAYTILALYIALTGMLFSYNVNPHDINYLIYHAEEQSNILGMILSIKIFDNSFYVLLMFISTILPVISIHLNSAHYFFSTSISSLHK